MQERHLDRKKYFEEQAYTTEKYVIPFISGIMPVTADLNVAEIGCGEGGNLLPFLNMGCKVTGIDLSEYKLTLAGSFFKDNPFKKNLELIKSDIYDIRNVKGFKYDLIIMRDTLEHIPNQYLLLEHLKSLLKPGGKIFIAFPPWRMPFGGHQQICESRFLSKLPYFHILPGALYRLILKSFGESLAMMGELMNIKETGISLQKFKRIVVKAEYRIEKQTCYLINPNYFVKFGLGPKKLPAILNIPYVRDFFVTTFYCIISGKD